MRSAFNRRALFDHALQRAQRRHAATAGDLQPHLPFPSHQREHTVRSAVFRRLQCRDAQRKTQRLELRRAQHLLQQLDMGARNTHKHCMLLACRRHQPRGGDLQRRDIGRKSAFRFDLQKTRDIRGGKFRNCRVGCQGPLQRQRDDAMAFPHAGGLEMVQDLASDQFGVVGQQVERQGYGESLVDVQRTVGSP